MGLKIDRLETLIKVLNRWLNWAAGGALVAMMLLACGNMITRVPGYPIKGTYELVGFFAALVAAFALGYTQLQKGHTRVDILTSRLPLRAQVIIDIIVHFFSMVLFVLLTWRVAVFARSYWSAGEVSETLNIIFYPFTYGVALSCAFIALVLLLDFLKSLAQAVKK